MLQADKHVDLANVFLVKGVLGVAAKDNEGNKSEITDTTKVTIYCRNYKRVCKVRGGCIWSSARWVM